MDSVRQHCQQVAEALHEELTAALAKMASKEEFDALCVKHQQLSKTVDTIMDGLETRFKNLETVQAGLQRRSQLLEDSLERQARRTDDVYEQLRAMNARFAGIEATLPTKADLEATEKALMELRAEVDKIDAETLHTKLAENTERIDRMDARCDRMEDEAVDLKLEVGTRL